MSDNIWVNELSNDARMSHDDTVFSSESQTNEASRENGTQASSPSDGMLAIQARMDRRMEVRGDYETLASSRMFDAPSIVELSSLLPANYEDELHHDDVNENVRTDFDIQLPYQHLYLGRNLRSIPGYAYLEERSTQYLPLLPSHKLMGLSVLIPGQIIPVNLRESSTSRRIKQCLENRIKTFAFICRRSTDETSQSGFNSNDSKNTFGVILEFFEFGTNYDSNEEFLCKARVSQRIRVLKYPFESMMSGRPFFAQVFILPDILLEDPLRQNELVQMSLNRIRKSHSLKCDKREASLTRWPSFVYKNYQYQYLVNDLKKRVTLILGNDHGELHIPHDPLQLSYWILANMPLSDSKRLEILQVDNIIQRLRRLKSEFLHLNHLLKCSNCLNDIAFLKDIFLMSASGPLGTYVNPNGYIHETITLYNVQNVEVDAITSTNYSWFPGYAWSIAYCAHCKTHVGWKFRSVQRYLVPQRFFGLAKRSISM